MGGGAGSGTWGGGVLWWGRGTLAAEAWGA
jgi:hypothetical protein